MIVLENILSMLSLTVYVNLTAHKLIINRTLHRLGIHACESHAEKYAFIAHAACKTRYVESSPDSFFNLEQNNCCKKEEWGNETLKMQFHFL